MEKEVEEKKTVEEAGEVHHMLLILDTPTRDGTANLVVKQGLV